MTKYPEECKEVIRNMPSGRAVTTEGHLAYAGKGASLADAEGEPASFSSRTPQEKAFVVLFAEYWREAGIDMRRQ